MRFKQIIQILLLLGFCLETFCVAQAEVRLAPLFSDGVILQQGIDVPVWGTAKPGEMVTVRFKGQTKIGKADQSGRWMIYLEKMPACTTPADFSVEGANTIKLSDVLVGEVWLCSGQSNMLFKVRQAVESKREIAAANYPLIREFNVRSIISDQPLVEAKGEWQRCSPETVPEFSAIGYFFARDLHRNLGTPIGIIKTTLGGSPIEAWMSDEALRATAYYSEIARRWKAVSADYDLRSAEYARRIADWMARPSESTAAQSDAARPTKQYVESDRNKPSGLYNGFIRPLVPFALAGVLWYQGEGNVERAGEYGELFRAMIAHWRADFVRPDLPFYFVQLANFEAPSDKTHRSWASLREAQASALTLKNTGMAVAIDVGLAADIHPPNKQAVAARLARIALKNRYGEKINDQGPIFVSVTPERRAIRVTFSNASGLRFAGAIQGGFEIAGKNRLFYPASAVVSAGTVLLSSPKVARPVAVRYNWTNCPSGSLVNDDNLPAAPFRTDRW